MTRRALVWLVMLVLVGGLVSAGALADQSKQSKEEYYELHKLLVDTLDQVEQNYVKDVTRRELVEAAIKGILSELDPYSSYIGPDELGQFRTTVDGNFGGIGIQIVVDRGRLEVLSPLVGTPAYRAGMMAGDQITEINGKSTKGITLDEAVARLKGEVGSEITLTVIHPGKSEPEKVTVTRELVRVNTVLGDHRKKDDNWDFMLDSQKQIGYVRITAFTRDTPRDLRKALEELKKDDLRGLILDLRFNPGGLLRSAIEVSDLFVSKGRIVSTKGRDPDGEQRAWEAHAKDSFEGFPMVVLVNRYTASAGEIVSACLQDHKRAVIMGERTWGKGSVQNVIPLEGGRSALKLTTASYRRPSGKKIDKYSSTGDDEDWGVMPDDGYLLNLTDEELVSLLTDRRERDILRPKQPDGAQAGQTDREPRQSEENPDGGPSKADESASGQGHEPHEPPGEQKATEPEESEFVDPQLRMAVDYLTAELAGAN